MEVKTDVKTVRLDFKCPDCESGYLRPTGVVLTTFPPMYPHKCNNPQCTFGQTFNETYPRVDYEPTQTLVLTDDQIAERLAAFINFNNQCARATLGDLPLVTKEDLIGYYQQVKKKIENPDAIDVPVENDGQLIINDSSFSPELQQRIAEHEKKGEELLKDINDMRNEHKESNT